MSKITKENTPKTSNDEASEIIKKIIGLHEKHKGEKKYYLNVIEECRAYENAHTRILLKLFMYKNTKGNVFLKKFIGIINDEMDLRGIDGIDLEDKSEICIEYQYHKIDGYIKDSDNEWAIIIENKINNAKDMPRQIERYTKDVLKEVKKGNIFVVYLTLDGSKKITEESLTGKVRKKLEFSESNDGRFLELNYRRDILPILEGYKCLIPENEENLRSAIVQYKDFIMEKLQMNGNNDEYNTNMCQGLCQELGEILTFNDNMKPEEKIKKIDEQAELIEERLESLKEYIFPTSYRAETIRYSMASDFRKQKQKYSKVKNSGKDNAVYLRVNGYKDKDDNDLRVGIVFDNEEEFFFTCAICKKDVWNQLSDGEQILNKKSLEKYKMKWVGGKGNNYYYTTTPIKIKKRYSDEASKEIKEKFEEFVKAILEKEKK